MRIAKISDQEILNGLMSVFRAKGYDGASLNELAEATGLKKASLYHRFPGGKKEMTDAVLDFMEHWVSQKIFAVLSDTEKHPVKRLDEAINNLSAVYNGGKEVCIYRSLSMDTGMALFGEKIEKGINRWLAAFVALGKAQKFDGAKADALAKQAFIEVQGSLVLSKAMGNTAPFENALNSIKERYLNT